MLTEVCHRLSGEQMAALHRHSSVNNQKDSKGCDSQAGSCNHPQVLVVLLDGLGEGTA